MSLNTPPPFPELPDVPNTKPLVPLSRMSPGAGLSSAHIFWQSGAKRQETIPSSRLSWPSITFLNLATSSRIMHHSELFSSSTVEQICKARALGFGKKPSEIEIQCRLPSVPSWDRQWAYQAQKDHLHSRCLHLWSPSSDIFGPRQPKSEVSREG